MAPRTGTSATDSRNFLGTGFIQELKSSYFNSKTDPGLHREAVGGVLICFSFLLWSPSHWVYDLLLRLRVARSKCFKFLNLLEVCPLLAILICVSMPVVARAKTNQIK